MCRKGDKASDIEFFYRGTNLPRNLIITSVILKGENRPKEFIERKQNEMINKKNYLNLVKLNLREYI